jgi:phosphate butyryltransferase
MKNFAEIVAGAPSRRIVFAPAPSGKIPPEAEAVAGGKHKITAVETVKEACRMVRDKEADILMQGPIPLSEFFTLLEEEGVKRDDLSFVTVMENQKTNKLLLLTDTYIHNYPGLKQKTDILVRAVAFSHLLGLKKPNVAALSAIETINAAIPSTIEAAILSKMSERRQFQAIVEGPLDIDAVLQKQAAVIKGIDSPVPGDADIILCPDIETAFALSQAFTFIGSYPTAGLLLGTFPIVINPRLIPSACKEVEIALQSLRAGDPL